MVTRIFERQDLVELLWNGFTGLFPRDSVQIVKHTDLEEIKKHITLGKDSKSQANNVIESLKMIYSDRRSQPADSERSLHDIYKEVQGFEQNQYKNIRNPSFERTKMDRSRVENNDLLPPTQNTASKSPNKVMMRQMRRQQEYNIKSDNVENVAGKRKYY